MDAPSPAAPTPSAPMSGLVYADVPNRVIAIIIDGIILFLLLIVLGIILAAIGLATGAGASAVASIVYAVLGLAVGAAYFIYTWTSMRATIGMRALGMQIGNAGDGKTLTMDQATRRWLVIALPGILAQVLFVLPALGALIGLLAFGWFIYLLWTTYSSPTKQGFHDKYANTMVVKAARSAG